MGLLSALLGHASEADVDDVEENLEKISNFSVETAGHLDLEAELKIWISGNSTPIEKTFTRGSTILEVQKALATYVGR